MRHCQLVGAAALGGFVALRESADQVSHCLCLCDTQKVWEYSVHHRQRASGASAQQKLRRSHDFVGKLARSWNVRHAGASLRPLRCVPAPLLRVQNVAWPLSVSSRVCLCVGTTWNSKKEGLVSVFGRVTQCSVFLSFVVLMVTPVVFGVCVCVAVLQARSLLAAGRLASG